MSFINDLNKAVNTFNKIDKMLSDKPKRTRVIRKSISFTDEEWLHIYSAMQGFDDEQSHKIAKRIKALATNLNY